MIASALPQVFSPRPKSGPAPVYFSEPLNEKLAAFFDRKGLAGIKEEDRQEHWYDDWIAYQREHQLYARLLAPQRLSSLGEHFDLLRYARFLELFAWFSPAHGYSLQVSFLGLWAIMQGTNEPLKREAVQVLEKGGLFAFGVSERAHGADLLANDFTLREVDAGQLLANGSKYYIGNANAAAMIAVLARREGGASAAGAAPVSGRSRRALPALLAIRPASASAFGNVQKIRTLGVRAGFVGSFDVTSHELPHSDVIAEGRDAWEAVFGTVTLGKFFLGFGSIGICQHALSEAAGHLHNRILYGKPALEMPHLRLTMAQAYARLAAMKLYAYRALDYVHAATADDRRYLLFNAVQKAKVSTEGVRVMALLSECIGAKGFEAETYFEMALRDAQLIPGLEGSTHINLTQAAQFIPQYFAGEGADDAGAPPSLWAAGTPASENEYLQQARSTAVHTIRFPHFLRAYESLRTVRNVRVFSRQIKGLSRWLSSLDTAGNRAADAERSMALGHALATIAYGQLIAENALLMSAPAELVSAIFHGLVSDLSAVALTLAAAPWMDAAGRRLAKRVVAAPKTTREEWRHLAERIESIAVASRNG